MAEALDDIGYEINNDPVPKQPGLPDKERAKLDGIVQSMIKNRESDAVIKAVVDDFKSKYSAPGSQPQIDISTPSFKPAAPISGVPKVNDFSYTKPDDELGVAKMAGRAKVASEKIRNELLGNNDTYEKKVREIRRDSYTIENLRNDYKKQGIILSPQDEKSFLQKEKQKRYDAPIQPHEIDDIKTGALLNEKFSRKVLKDLNKSDVQEALYTLDKFNELSSDPNGHTRTEKVKDVAKKIGKGQVIYDPERKIAIQPLGVIGSIVEGTKNKFKIDEEHDFFKNAPDRSIIMELENERNNPDTDEPVKVPKGRLQEALMSLSEMPLKPIIAGAAGTIGGAFIGNPELGTIAASAAGAYESRRAAYASTFKQVYNELRDQNKSELESIQEARKQADQAQEVGTIVGAAQGYVGGKIGEVPLRGAGFSGGYQKAIGNLLKQNGSELGKIVLEGAAQGGIGAGGALWKNQLARAAGIKRDITEGAADEFWSNLLMTVGIGAAIKAGRGLTKVDYRNVLHGLSKLPEEKINSAIQEKVDNGEITQSAASEASQRISEYKAKDTQIPPSVTDEARFKIQDNIDKINELEAQKEATHPSLHGPIKEEIEKLTKENLELARETEKPIKSESGLSKSAEKEAIETAEEFIAEGVVPDVYAEMVKKDPIGFWKMIAQQSQNVDENWKPLDNPVSEESVRDQFGDTVVDYAKELFPAPKESEVVGHVEITEHGEDTKAANKEENGVEPTELSKEGVKEANELGQYLIDNNKKRIVTSEIERAKETGRIAGEKAGIPVESTEVLNTVNIGSDEGKPEGTFNEREWLNGNYLPEGAEKPEEFINRMEQAYQYVKSLPEDTHVVAHSKVMRALEALEKTNGKWTEQTTTDFLNSKEPTHAIQESSTSGVLQYPQEGTGEAGGERGGVEPREQGEASAGTRTEEKGQAEGAKKEVMEGGIPPNMFDLPFTPEEGDVSRLAHADTERLYREMGMQERMPRATKTDISLENEADTLIREGYDFNAKADRILNGTEKSFTDAEQVAFAKMVGALKAKLNNTPIESPDFNSIQSQIEKLSRASDIVGSEEGAAFRARRMFVLNDETLSDFLTRAKQANKDAPLTEEQTKEVKKQWDEFDAAKKGYEKEVKKSVAKSTKEKAEKKVKETTSTTKKTKKTREEYTKERKDIVAAMRADLLKVAKGGGGALSSVPGAAQLQAVAPYVMKLLKSFAEEGVIKLEDFVKKIHGEIKDYIEGITEKDVQDILAGEYNEKKQSRSELAERSYNVKRQAALINKLERMQAGVKPKNERALRKRNQEVEALKKQIKEFGKEEIEAARQARKDYSNLETERNRQLKKVSDLKEKLSSLQSGVRHEIQKRISKKDTPEIEALKERISDAEKELNKTIATDKRVKSLEAELDRVKERREKEPKQESKKVLSDRELDLKNQIESEKKAWADEERIPPEEVAINTLKSRYKKLAEEYERRLKEGDFEDEVDAPPIVLGKEGQEAKDRYIEAKKNWELGLAKQEYENRSGVEKATDLALNVLELRRAVGTAYDFSVPFRQAIAVTINPFRAIETGRAFKEMFSQWWSGKNLDRWWFDLEQSSDYKEMLEDGLPVHSPNELRISKREEEFRTKLAEAIPGVKMSNRAASGYLNSMRVDMYRKMRGIMQRRGITRRNNPEAYKELGKYIGNMTGSGNLLSWLEGKPSKALGATFFGARLMASKFNLLNPYYYYKIPKEFRKTALFDLAARVGMYGAIGFLAHAAGLSISLNPNDPDFLKIKHGNTTYDITGGEAIYVRTFLRILGAAWERISGEEKSSLKAAEKAGLSVTSFFRNKLAPTPSYGLDAFMGKTSWGAKFDPYDIVRIYPMWVDDIVEDWKQDKAASILLAGIPSIMGIGVMSKQQKGGSSGGAGATVDLKEVKPREIKYKEIKYK